MYAICHVVWQELPAGMHGRIDGIHQSKSFLQGYMADSGDVLSACANAWWHVLMHGGMC